MYPTVMAPHRQDVGDQELDAIARLEGDKSSRPLVDGAGEPAGAELRRYGHTNHSAGEVCETEFL
jgi:hypothetical protein